MPTKPRTKKPAAKPQRKTRATPANPRIREVRKYKEAEARPSSAEIRQRILDRYEADETGAVKAVAEAMAKALGRNLDDLLSVKQGTAVDAWQASSAVAPTTATDAPAKSISPVEEAVARLLGAVCTSECLTDTTADRLKDIVSNSPPGPSALLGSTEPGGSSELAARLNCIADRIYADGRRRLDILNRLEL